jgi:hypothetical protein
MGREWESEIGDEMMNECMYGLTVVFVNLE